MKPGRSHREAKDWSDAPGSPSNDPVTEVAKRAKSLAGKKQRAWRFNKAITRCSLPCYCQASCPCEGNYCCCCCWRVLINGADWSVVLCDLDLWES
ncbi:hypothetical protein E2C01_097610 [Portunus trituberculatus]|uniref:Uncharacterized protein n=1 Tax=Portunus trituberculatus TaxID=210409 RepID=A0A5B7KBU9_PORTR|nr:hypothetical protein [Portunus trituberculatus]